MKKRFTGTLLIGLVSVVAIIGDTTRVGVSAVPAIQYESRINIPITKGVYYEFNRMITDSGLRDIHVITVDLTNEYIQIRPIHSQIEHGLRETTSNLVRSNGAIAGINGDFFGLANLYCSPFGLTIVDGNIKSMSEGSNSSTIGFSTFLLDEDRNPFMRYIQSTVSFWNNGVQNINLFSMNRTSDMNLPTYIDRTAFTTTASLDARFPNLYKIVVEYDTIVHISGRGETVEVPENGFVIILSEHTARYHLRNFNVGENAVVTTSTGIDLDRIQTAISGGSRILEEGQVVADGHIVSGRQPRTAIGISEDGTRLTLMVVDGRNHSVGATHEELAFLLQHYGVFNAMHLDGGGSSTMALQAATANEVEVVNSVSAGTERRVINGLGIFNNSVPSYVTRLHIETETEVAFRNVPVRLDVMAFDRHFNRIAIEGYNVQVANAGQGYIIDGYFHPTAVGNVSITATYGDITTETNIFVTDLAELTPASNMLYFARGDRYIFRFTGMGILGHQGAIDYTSLQYEVVPAHLGTVENGVFIAQDSGAGYIRASLNGVSSYMQISVGRTEGTITRLATIPARFVVYPSIVSGHITHIEGLDLHYNFIASDITQAAYAVFNDPIPFSGRPISLRLDVYGDDSNNWIRGVILDNNNTRHIIDFTRDINFSDLRSLVAPIPNNVVYPIRLERIYVVALQTQENFSSTLTFRSVVPQYPVDNNIVVLPQSTVFVDHLAANLTSAPIANEFDITFLGNIVPTVSSSRRTKNYQEIQTNSLELVAQNTRFGIFFDEVNSPRRNHEIYVIDDILFIEMTLHNGSIYNSDLNQWRGLNSALSTSNSNNIIVTFNRNPLTTLSSQELDLFNELLVQHLRAGRNIFVISNDGTVGSSTAKNGIRYINIPNLWNSDGTLNDNFQTLRLRFSEGYTRFDLR